MGDKKFKVIGKEDTQKTIFGDVVSALAADKKLNQRALAEEVGCSPSTLSLVGHGERPLKRGIAIEIAKVLGGTAETWESIYDETKQGSAFPVRYFRDLLVDAPQPLELPGSRVRRLRKLQIINMMLSGLEYDFDTEGRNRFDIDPFDKTRTKETSYDTTIGSIRDPDDNSRIEVRGRYEVPPRTSVIAKTKEAIVLPFWMEAEVHPATSLAKKHLIVSGGPIIDPGFDDFLTAAIYNPTGAPVLITDDEPFLTLRFWLQELD